MLPDLARRHGLLDPYATENNEQRIREVLTPSWRVRPERATGTVPGVSVVILNLNKPELILPLLDRLFFQQQAFEREGLKLELLIGDTGSTDSRVLAAYEKHSERVTVMRGLKYQFSRCNNQVAFSHSTCEALLFLNNDIVFPSGSVAILEMYRCLRDHPEAGTVGLDLLFPDKTVQHMGVEFSTNPEIRGLCFHPHSREKVDWLALPSNRKVGAVTGACLMTRSAHYWAVGGMDERYGAECQDVDLCLHLHRLGLPSVVVHAGDVIHIENGTRPKGDEHWPDRQRFMRHWGSYIETHLL